MLKRLMLILFVALLVTGCTAGGFETIGGSNSDLESADGAVAAVAFTWRREGGIAGFCDVVTVGLKAQAEVADCTRDVVVGQTMLTAEEAAMVDQWVARLADFEHVESDDAVADAMSLSVTFNGEGFAEPSDADIEAISDLATTLIRRVTSMK